MQTLEYRTVDKSEWLRGPWDDEPDKRQWQDEATGLPCLIVRNRGGALCGYVGLPPGHPLHGKDEGDVSADVHGGLTFSGFCHEGAEEEGICHKPDAGEPDHVWWLGFDCSHYRDHRPADHRYGHDGGCYRDIDYVTREVESLAKQLVAVETAA